MTTVLEYIGHSAFYLQNENNGILIDPFISQNPVANFDFKTNKITDILVTHGHADHLGDAIPVSKITQATVTAIFELANYCAERGAIVNGVNQGGKINFGWGYAIFLPAFHSNSTPSGVYAGMPCSILIDIDGTKIYHAGDTCLNQEMKTVGELYSPDYALLPIGSHYTMGVEEAAIAAKWLQTKKVIPMHYNTFDAINADVSILKNTLEKENIETLILKPSERIEL